MKNLDSKDFSNCLTFARGRDRHTRGPLKTSPNDRTLYQSLLFLLNRKFGNEVFSKNWVNPFVSFFVTFSKRGSKFELLLQLRSKNAGRFEKLLGVARSQSIVTHGSVSLSCATTPHPSCFSKSLPYI